MPSISETAYPRFRSTINKDELDNLYTPTQSEIGIQPTYVVRPSRVYIQTGGNPVKVRSSQLLCIESWRLYGNIEL